MIEEEDGEVVGVEMEMSMEDGEEGEANGTGMALSHCPDSDAWMVEEGIAGAGIAVAVGCSSHGGCSGGIAFRFLCRLFFALIAGIKNDLINYFLLKLLPYKNY